MRSIIREFYLGNLSPDATAIRQGSKLQKAVQEVSDVESFLREHLDGECLAALERLVSAQLTSSTTTAEERYMDGFRTGARFMPEEPGGTWKAVPPMRGRDGTTAPSEGEKILFGQVPYGLVECTPGANESESVLPSGVRPLRPALRQLWE